MSHYDYTPAAQTAPHVVYQAAPPPPPQYAPQQASAVLHHAPPAMPAAPAAPHTAQPAYYQHHHQHQEPAPLPMPMQHHPACRTPWHHTPPPPPPRNDAHSLPPPHYNTLPAQPLPIPQQAHHQQQAQQQFSQQPASPMESPPTFGELSVPEPEGRGAEWSIVADRFKTRMCRTWEQGGECQYMTRCMFAHGPSDLRTTEQNVADGLLTVEAVKQFQRRAVAARSGPPPAYTPTTPTALVVSVPHAPTMLPLPQAPPPPYSASLHTAPMPPPPMHPHPQSRPQQPMMHSLPQQAMPHYGHANSTALPPPPMPQQHPHPHPVAPRVAYEQPTHVPQPTQPLPHRGGAAPFDAAPSTYHLHDHDHHHQPPHQPYHVGGHSEHGSDASWSTPPHHQEPPAAPDATGHGDYYTASPAGPGPSASWADDVALPPPRKPMPALVHPRQSTVSSTYAAYPSQPSQAGGSLTSTVGSHSVASRPGSGRRGPSVHSAHTHRSRSGRAVDPDASGSAPWQESFGDSRPDEWRPTAEEPCYDYSEYSQAV